MSCPRPASNLTNRVATGWRTVDVLPDTEWDGSVPVVWIDEEDGSRFTIPLLPKVNVSGRDGGDKNEKVDD